MASTEFTFTQSAGTSTKKYTVSMWFKGRPLVSGTCGFWGCGTGTGDGTSLHWLDTGKFSLETWDGSSNPKAETTRLFRDPAAWYHLVFSIDTTNATADDRLKIWINGVRETNFGTYTTITQDSDIPGWSGSGDVMHIGNRVLDGDSFFEGSMSHVHIIDGTIYDASAFGETDSTSGIWVAKTSPSVTYGTNGGFYKFASGALTTDSSGNGNTLTQVGSPTNTQDTPDNNFCTMNPLENFYSNQTFTEGNNTIKSDDPAVATGTIGLTSGKWYWEAKCITTSVAGTAWQFGIKGNQNEGSSEYLGQHGNDYSYYGADGQSWNNGSGSSYGNTYDTGDIIGCAVDLTNNKLYFSKNGTWQNSGDPTSGSTGTGAISITNSAVDTPQGYYRPAAGANSSATKYTWSMNFGNGYFGTTAVASTNADDAGIGSFEYDIPAGYYAICTTNLGDQS